PLVSVPRRRPAVPSDLPDGGRAGRRIRGLSGTQSRVGRSGGSAARGVSMQLEMDHVWRTYRVGDSDVVALGDVSVRIQSGELVAVVGPSGSGKSTFLQLIGLLDSPSEGAVRFDGEDVGSLGDAQRTEVRLQSLGFIFQRFHLLNHLTAVENVMLPLEAAGVAIGERF